MTSRSRTPLRRLCPSLAASALALGLTLVFPTRTARAEVLDRVVAVLDEDAIFLSDLERRARPFLAELPTGGTPEQILQRRNEMLQNTLDRMIDDQLMHHAATRAHITVSDDEIDEFIGRIARERGATADEVYAALAQEGVPRAEYRSYMETEVLRLKVLQLRVRGRINITDNDLQEEYRRAVRDNTQASVLHAAHILLHVPEDATPAQLVEIRHTAEEIARRARAGEDFATLARQYSQDEGSRDAGGDLGEIQPGALPEALNTALARMQPGDVSDPVQGPNGFHVLRLTSRDAVAPPPFAQVRDRLYAVLLNREMLRQQRIYLRELRQGASVDNRLVPTGSTSHPASPAAPATPSP